MKLTTVSTFEELTDDGCLPGATEYNDKGLLKDVVDPDNQGEGIDQLDHDGKEFLEEKRYKADIVKFSNAFDGQNHYGVFYAYMRLKEQEIRNICWLAEMVKQKLHPSDPRWQKYKGLIPFDIYDNK